jgi:hypothetical protein
MQLVHTLSIVALGAILAQDATFVVFDVRPSIRDPNDGYLVIFVAAR